MTCNAQSNEGSGYNRWLRNEQVRQYCTDNNKVLFDFADLDSWSDGVQNTYEHIVDDVTYNIPLEHEDLNGNEAGHTTYTSCEQKGRAFWWLMALLAGWNATPTTNTGTGAPEPPDMLLITASLGAVVIVIMLLVVVSRRS